VIQIKVEPDAQTLLYEGKVDVWMGYVHDEPIAAELSGHPVTNIYPADYGVGGYEGLLLTNESTIRERPELVERFVRATARGWRYSVENQGEAAAVLTRWQPDDSLEFQEMAVRSLVPLVDVPPASIGWIDADRWQRLMGDGYQASRPGFTMQFLRDLE
jgi:ABC-type nitrate/sulfonate/bicarbonate transport system substrate-binding protein